MQLFSPDGKPAENLLYMSLGGWGESDAGDLEISQADGTMHTFKTEDADEIAAAMSIAARQLASAMKK